MARTKLLNRIKPYQHIIWDWNGTIIDDVKIGVEVVSEMLKRQGLPELSLEQYRDRFRFPISEYYKTLGFDFEKTSYHDLSEEFMNLYSSKSHKVTIFSEMKEVLSEVAKTKTQSILSAGAQWYLEAATIQYNIQHYFTHIFGLDNYFANSKLQRGQELVLKSKVCPSQTLLIGDTDHDLEVGRALGIDVLLTADGHQSFERLSKNHKHVLPTGLRTSINYEGEEL